jgi:hypothetical protein
VLVREPSTFAKAYAASKMDSVKLRGADLLGVDLDFDSLKLLLQDIFKFCCPCLECASALAVDETTT